MSSRELFLKDDTLITSKTDLKGRITYGNKDFINFGRYQEKDFLRKPHNLVRHPKMPRVAFKFLWEFVQNGNEFFAFVCNLSKLGETYWVFVNVTPSYDDDGKIIGYYSVRRRPSKEGIETIMEIYNKCLELESKGGLEASTKFVTNLLQENNISWNNFIINLQNKAKTGGYR